MVPDNVRDGGVASGPWSAAGSPSTGLPWMSLAVMGLALTGLALTGLALMGFMAGRCDPAMPLSRGAPDAEAILSSGRLRLGASALDRRRRRRRGIRLHGSAALLDRLGSRGLGGGRELDGAVGLRVQKGDDVRPVRALRQAGEAHLGPLDRLLGRMDEGVEVVERPGLAIQGLE